MSRRRLIGMVAAGVGAGAAALGTGLVVERKVVRDRKAGAAGTDSLGGLHSDPVVVTADDGLSLHAEVDETAPYATGTQDRAPSEVTLLFVHGYALTMDCWHFQRQHYRGKRRMVFYDQRSHGRSERSSRENATIEQLGQDLTTVLDELAPDGPVVLVGHSMGGMAIMAYAEEHPELFGDRVVGAALISTTAGGLRPHRTISRLIPDRIGGTIGPRLMAALARAPELVDSARRGGSNIGFLVTERFAFGGDVPASYVEFVDEMLAGTPFDVLAEFFPNFEAMDKYAVLHAFASVPTTILCGTRDLLTSIDHSRKMSERVEGARLVEVAGAGHMVILEQADKVNRVLDELVAEAERLHSASPAS
ncbi:MAG: alpha/beta fold hydrolase [Nocardioides sp.]